MRSLIDKQNQQEASPVLTERDEALAVPSFKQASRSAQLLKLQRTHGNQFVQRLLKRSDSATASHGHADAVQASSFNLQRRADGEASATEAPPQVYQALRSPGLPLDPSSREFFESSFGGLDFSHVRLHTDSDAAQSAASVDALAYTVGSDVFFGGGQYAPETSAGQQLLAHELTHVVQQGAGTGGGGGISEKLEVGEAGDVYEQEADQVAAQVMRRASRGASASPSVSAAEHSSVAPKQARGTNRISRQTPDGGVVSTPVAPPTPTAAHTETAAAPGTATPTATEAKAAETKPAEPTTIKGALASIQVEQHTDEELRLQPESMFKLLPDNTQAKREAFGKALTAISKLRKASAQVASFTADPKKARELAKATTDFEDAQTEIDAAIAGIKKLLQSHLEGKDAELKKLRRDASTAQANLNAVKKQGAKADPKKLKEAEDALKTAQDAVDAREQELSDKVDESGEFDPALIKRTYYTITIDGEKIDLKDHIEAYATIYANGLDASARSEKKGVVADTLKNSGLSESRIKILKVISGLEGGFSATQSWDRAVITWGFAQWTGGSQSDLTAALTVIKKVAPEAFKKRFQKYGIDVEKNQLVVSSEEDAPAPAAGEKADQKKAPPKITKVKGDAAAKAIQESPSLTAVMARAGQDADIQLAQVKAANQIEINQPLDSKVEVTLTIKPPEEEKPKAAEAKPGDKKPDDKKADDKKTEPMPVKTTDKAAEKTTEKAADKDKAKVKKPEPKPEKKKLKVRVGDVITSEYGVGLLANRSVHSGYPSTINIVKNVLNNHAAKQELQPDDFTDADAINEWADDAEKLIRPAITEDTSRAKKFVDAGCSDAQGSFVP
ncbi:MAG TPA: DUF4157 domain-containing protein [Pyrinomonadaceae bacterium]|jgi:hypothetical protein|nr:DUF4157 domain-containing protein [Pyrinomonadaceae bacterium]